MLFSFLFLFNDTTTTQIYTLSLHDALPIWNRTNDRHSLRQNFRPDPRRSFPARRNRRSSACQGSLSRPRLDRKSTRLNSSHTVISYAVFCLKKKKKNANKNYTKIT